MRFLAVQVNGRLPFQNENSRALIFVGQRPRPASEVLALVQPQIIEVLTLFVRGKDVGSESVPGVAVISQKGGEVGFLAQNMVVDGRRTFARRLFLRAHLAKHLVVVGFLAPYQ